MQVQAVQTEAAAAQSTNGTVRGRHLAAAARQREATQSATRTSSGQLEAASQPSQASRSRRCRRQTEDAAKQQNPYANSSHAKGGQQARKPVSQLRTSRREEGRLGLPSWDSVRHHVLGSHKSYQRRSKKLPRGLRYKSLHAPSPTLNLRRARAPANFALWQSVTAV